MLYSVEVSRFYGIAKIANSLCNNNQYIVVQWETTGSTFSLVSSYFY